GAPEQRMDLRVKVAISEKNELKNKAPPVHRTADLALFSLPHVLFRREDEKDNGGRLFFSGTLLTLRQGERETSEMQPTTEDRVFVCGWILMTGLCNENQKNSCLRVGDRRVGVFIS
ncbi:hypothetical protein M9458_035446, partial [Cirrhinus mrigala]